MSVEVRAAKDEVDKDAKGATTPFNNDGTAEPIIRGAFIYALMPALCEAESVEWTSHERYLLIVGGVNRWDVNTFCLDLNNSTNREPSGDAVTPEFPNEGMLLKRKKSVDKPQKR